jgi:DnaK suppressor protein
MSMDEESLSEEQLKILTELLHQRHDEIKQELVTSKQDSKPVDLDLSIGRLSRMDAMQQQQMAAARKKRLEIQFSQTVQALSKLDEGEYGDCVRCGEPIGYQRLTAKPESPFCMACQSGKTT